MEDKDITYYLPMKQIITVLFGIMLGLSCTDKIIDNSDTYIVDINNTTNLSNYIDSCNYFFFDTNY